MNNDDNKIETKYVLVFLVLVFIFGYNMGKGNEGLRINTKKFPVYGDLSYENYETRNDGFNLVDYADDLLEHSKEDLSECLSSILVYEDENYDYEESPMSKFDRIADKFDKDCKVED